MAFLFSCDLDKMITITVHPFGGLVVCSVHPFPLSVGFDVQYPIGESQIEQIISDPINRILN